MGGVMAPWGVKGALKIEPFGAGSGNLCKYSAWWVGKPGKLSEVAVAECRAHGAYLVARFEGCDGPERAGAYRGAEVALRREDLPEPAAHEFYQDRKSTRLNSSHANNSYAVFCLKKKTTKLAEIPCSI